MWEDEKTLCYQVDANNVSVVRRADNNMINGTKLLNVAQMTRGRRDGILKSEKVRHVVKIGSMHLKGVWIPFERALAMAQREGIVDLLYPLFVRDIKRVIQTGITPNKQSYYDSPHHTGTPQPEVAPQQSPLQSQRYAETQVQPQGQAPVQTPQGQHQPAPSNQVPPQVGAPQPPVAPGAPGVPAPGAAGVYGYQQYYPPSGNQYYAYNGYPYNPQMYPQYYAKPKDDKPEKKE